MNCGDLIIAKLKEIGADGLCCENCGCGIDDLIPCSNSCCLSCEAAKRIKKPDGTEIFIPLEEKKKSGNYRGSAAYKKFYCLNF